MLSLHHLPFTVCGRFLLQQIEHGFDYLSNVFFLSRWNLEQSAAAESSSALKCLDKIQIHISNSREDKETLTVTLLKTLLAAEVPRSAARTWQLHLNEMACSPSRVQTRTQMKTKEWKCSWVMWFNSWKNWLQDVGLDFVSTEIGWMKRTANSRFKSNNTNW